MFVQRKASEKNLVGPSSEEAAAAVSTATPFEDIFSTVAPQKSAEDAEFDKIAASRSTPQQERVQNSSSSGLGELAVLDQWGVGPSVPSISNNPFGSPSDGFSSECACICVCVLCV